MPEHEIDILFSFDFDTDYADVILNINTKGQIILICCYLRRDYNNNTKNYSLYSPFQKKNNPK